MSTHQRGDDQRYALSKHRRQLIAQALPSAGRHQHKHVAPRHGRVDDLLLVAPAIQVDKVDRASFRRYSTRDKVLGIAMICTIASLRRDQKSWRKL